MFNKWQLIYSVRNLFSLPVRRINFSLKILHNIYLSKCRWGYIEKKVVSYFQFNYAQSFYRLYLTEQMALKN